MRIVWVILLFAVLVCGFTSPLYKHMSTQVPGISSENVPYASIWDSWRIQKAYKNKESLRTTTMIAYPFGAPALPAGLGKYIGTALHYIFSLLLKPVVIVNFQVILNLILSGLIVYILASFVTSSRLAGVFAGIVFALCPYQFSSVMAKLTLTYNEWIPLVLLTALLTYAGAATYDAAGWYILGVLFLFSFNYSIAYIGVTALACLCVYVVFFRWRAKFFGDHHQLDRDRAYLRKMLFLTVIAIVLLLPQLISLFSRFLIPALSAQAVTPDLSSLISTRAAGALSYLAPSPLHPYFGEWVRQAGLGLSVDSPPVLFPGWTVIILSVWMTIRWVFRKHESGSGMEQFYIGFFIFLAVAGFLISQPPVVRVGQFSIVMPAVYLHKILPSYHDYGAFGILLILACAVLASFGVKRITDGIRIRFFKPFVTIACSALIIFEFWMWPPPRVVDVSQAPEAYMWLKGQDASLVVAEYPLAEPGNKGRYLFYQTVHEKKLINGARPNTRAAEVAKEITALSDPRTAGILAWLGAKYVLVHRDLYEKSGLQSDQQELAAIPGNTGLTLVQSFPAQACPDPAMACTRESGPVDAYLVSASPIESQQLK